MGNKDVRKHGHYVPEHQVGPETFFALPLAEICHHEGGDSQHGNCRSKCPGSGMRRHFLGVSDPPCRESDRLFGVVQRDSDGKEPLQLLKRHGGEPSARLVEADRILFVRWHQRSPPQRRFRNVLLQFLDSIEDRQRTPTISTRQTAALAQ